MAYLTVADIRADPRLDKLQALSDEMLASYVADFTETAEAYLDAAYEPRDAEWSGLIRRTTNELRLPHRHIRAVSSIVVDDETLADRLYQVDPSGSVRFGYGYRLDPGDEVTVSYSHGLDEPPSRLIAACRRYVLAEASADAMGTSRNVIGQSVDGSYVRYSTPDWHAGRPTGWLNVDRDLNTLRGDRPVLVA